MDIEVACDLFGIIESNPVLSSLDGYVNKTELYFLIQEHVLMLQNASKLLVVRQSGFG